MSSNNRDVLPRRWLLELADKARAARIIFSGVLRTTNHQDKEEAVRRFAAVYKEILEELRPCLGRSGATSPADPLVATAHQALAKLVSTFRKLGRHLTRKSRRFSARAKGNVALAKLMDDLYQTGERLREAVSAVPESPLLEAMYHPITPRGSQAVDVTAAPLPPPPQPQPKRAVGSKKSQKNSKKREPSPEEFRAYQQHVERGEIQTRVAKDIFGDSKHQYKISRAVERVKEHLANGGEIPGL